MADLTPASASPLLKPTLPVTRGSIVSAVPSLDDKIEYLDLDGVPRRSETLTRRMVLRGHTIESALELSIEEQAHESLSLDSPRSEQSRVEEERVFEAKRKANAEFKRKCKQERQQWIDEADELITTRLQLWYDGKNADTRVVDVTDHHTADSPSKKTQAFIDEDGNLRRKSAPQADLTAEPGALKIVDPSQTAAEDMRPADAVAPPPAPSVTA